MQGTKSHTRVQRPHTRSSHNTTTRRHHAKSVRRPTTSHLSRASTMKKPLRRSFSTQPTTTTPVNVKELEAQIEALGDSFESLVENASDNKIFFDVSSSGNFQRLRELTLFIQDRAVRYHFSGLAISNLQVKQYCEKLLQDNPEHDYARAIVRSLPADEEHTPEGHQWLFRPSFWRHESLDSTDFAPIEYIKFLNAVSQDAPIEDFAIWESVGLLFHYCGFPLDLVETSTGSIQTRYANSDENETITNIVQSTIVKSPDLLQRLFIDSSIEDHFSYITAPWFQNLMQASYLVLNVETAVNLYSARFAKDKAVPFAMVLADKSRFNTDRVVQDDDGDEVKVSALTAVKPVSLAAISTELTFPEVYYLTLASAALLKLVAGYGIAGDASTPAIASIVIDNKQTTIAAEVDLDNIAQFVLEPRNQELVNRANCRLQDVFDTKVLESRHWFDLTPGNFSPEKLQEFNFNRFDAFGLPEPNQATADASQIIEAVFTQSDYQVAK